MRVIVTGGLGYIGSHTTLELLKNDNEVLIIDNLSNSSKKVLSKLEFISKKKISFIDDDISNIYNYTKDIRNFNPKAIIHFAGLKSVEESQILPLLYYQQNVSNSIKLINFIDEIQCKVFIFSSSATVYGNPVYLPYDEKHPLNPTNTYGKTKLIIETILNDWSKTSSDKSAVLLRYFNPVGAHYSGLIGENPIGTPNNLMPYVSKVAVGKTKELLVYGNNYDTRDGTGIRDYIHVMDVAEGHINTYEHFKVASPQILNLNLGTGKGTSVLELVKSYEESNKVDIPYEFVDRRPGDLAKVVADNSRAKSILGWYPRKNLLEMCQDAWRWEIRKSKL